MSKTLPEYGLHHVGYVVEDLQDALAVMKANLGEIEYQIYDFKPTKAWCYEEPVTDYALKIAMISLKENGCCIELIQPVSEGLHRDLLADREGINHICFAVTGDYDQWRHHYFKAGAQFIFESETEDDVVGYRRCFYVKDTSNNIVEIKETPYFRS